MLILKIISFPQRADEIFKIIQEKGNISEDYYTSHLRMAKTET